MRSSRKAAGIILLAVMAAGLGVSLFDRSLRRPPGAKSVVQGRWASQWQAAFEDALPVRKGAVALWTLLHYDIFGEARPEVLVGSDGWLFSAEEFDPPAPLSVPLVSAVQRIAATRDLLAAKGIDLVVALVPTKASVERAHLGRYVIPPAIEARYAGALDALAGVGIVAPDLRTPMSAAAAAGADMYLRTDTHWTPQGAQRAAAVLAGAVVPLLVRHDSSRTPFASQPGASRVFSGDLLKFVPLGPWQGRGPAPDKVFESVTMPAPADADASDLFGELDIPIALVGTSYSVNPVSGFEGALKDAVDADILNVAVEGQGPFAPMTAYLASKAIDDPRPDILVWEIPERYLVPGPA